MCEGLKATLKMKFITVEHYSAMHVLLVMDGIGSKTLIFDISEGLLHLRPNSKLHI